LGREWRLKGETGRGRGCNSTPETQSIPASRFPSPSLEGPIYWVISRELQENLFILELHIPHYELCIHSILISSALITPLLRAAL